MKRLAFYVVAGLMLLAFPLVSMADVNYQGAAVSAAVKVKFTNASGVLVKDNFVAKNKGRQANVSFTFDNVSAIVTSGKVTFQNDGVWAGFAGTVLQPTASKFMGTVPVSGVVRLDGDVTFDLDTQTFTGTGHVVQFSGDMNLKGLLSRGNSGGQGQGKSKVGMVKIWINPNVADVVSVVDGVVDELTAPIPASLKISLPAVQLSLAP